MKTGNPVIKVQNLRKRYGRYEVLADLSFDVYAGESLAILGASGCGKSTLMRIMAGLEKASGGKVLLEDRNIHRCDTAKKTGVLFQNNALFGSMTIGENIALPIAEHTGLSREHINKMVDIKLGMVSLSEFKDYLPSQISGGMKKRVALARALALNPAILFLDEPTTGLDPISSAEIDQLILHINRSFGTTMVVVTHELDSVFAIADRVIMLDKSAKGKIAEGTPVYLKNDCFQPFVRQFFNRKSNNHGQTQAILTKK